MANNLPQQRTQTEVCATEVKNMLEKNRDAIMRSLPRGFDNYDRMVRSIINAISTTPQLAQCTSKSLFLATVQGFSLGLEPNGLLGHGYLVPFKDKGVMKAQFMPGYRGLIDISRRSGQLVEIYAAEVYANDLFEVSMGTTKELIHKPDMFSDRGEIKGWYAVFKLKDGSTDFEIMSKGEVENIRQISKAGGSNFSPWNSGHYNEMARKTVIKKILKRAPQSIDCAVAVNHDNAVAMGEPQDNSAIIDIVGGVVEDDQPTAGTGTEALAEKLGVENERSEDLDRIRKAFHARGVEIYGKGWDEARATICENYEVKSSNDLNFEQLHNMIIQFNEIKNN